MKSTPEPKDEFVIPEPPPSPPAPPTTREEWVTVKDGLQREVNSGRLRTSNDPWRRKP